MDKKAEVKVYAVGTERGRSVVWAIVNGSKIVIPTDAVTMARLAGYGVQIKNES